MATTPKKAKVRGPLAERTGHLLYALLAICPMLVGGAMLLYLYAFASMVGPGVEGAVFWHRVLSKIFPAMMLPLALANAGPAAIIGCLWYVAMGRPTPASLGLIVWAILTGAEVAGIGLFLWL